MLQTYEAILQPNWGLQFSDRIPPKFDQAQKVLVTVLSPDSSIATADVQTGWSQIIGVLKDSPVFGSDPIAAQQAMRDEWR